EFAQRRRLEGVIGGGEADDGTAALVLARQTDIVKVVVGQRKTVVAIAASPLAGEDTKAPPFGIGEGGGIASNPGIKARRRRYQSSLIGSQRQRQIAGLDFWIAGKSCGKGAGVAAVPREPQHGIVQAIAHFVGMLDGKSYLRLQACRATIPEQKLAPRHVP